MQTIQRVCNWKHWGKVRQQVSGINKMQPLCSGVGGKEDRGWFIAMEPSVSFEVCIMSAYYLFTGITELHGEE